MKKKLPVQYTVRQVPEDVDTRLRELAVKEECSLNYVVIDALSNAVGLKNRPPIFNDLDSLIGSWVEDDAFDSAVQALGKVDEELWR